MAKKRIKSTDTEERRRLIQVMELLLNGTLRCEIVAKLSEEWNCTVANVDAHIQKAKAKFKEHSDDELKEDMLAKHNMLYNKALMSGGLGEARANLQCISKLYGYDVTKVEHSGSLNIPEIIILKEIKDDNGGDKAKE